MTREEFIIRTRRMAEISPNETHKIKYWEILGKALGYLEPPKIENQNIAVFQSVSGEMMAFLKDKMKTEEVQVISTTPIDRNTDGEV